MIKVTSNIYLNEAEINITFVTSGGPGGQNVNKVATTAHLRFNVLKSLSLPEGTRSRLLFLVGNKLTNDGDLIIKAGRFRTQERNKQDALNRLLVIIRNAAIIPKKRKKTKPTALSSRRRLESKKLQAMKKMLRKDKEGN